MKHLKAIPGTRPTLLPRAQRCEKYKKRKLKAIFLSGCKGILKKGHVGPPQTATLLCATSAKIRNSARKQESAPHSVTLLGTDVALASVTVLPSGLESSTETVELELKEAESTSQVESGPAEVELTLDHILEVLTQLQYHTHQAEGVHICSQFLLGVCFQGEQCPQHHTALPYHWQLRRVATQAWESMTEEAQEILERLFCDPEKVHIRLNYKGNNFTLDFSSMLVWPNSTFDRVRRLSTAADSNLLFQPTFKFYWKDSSVWREYSEPFVQSIENALCQGVLEARCATLEYNYIINLAEGYQQNLATGTRRAVCYRPVFRSPVLLLPQIRTHSGTSSTSSSQSPRPAPLPSLNADKQYPETWVTMDASADFLQVMMSVEDRGYLVIYNLFHKSMPETKYMILGIMRVQNPFLWDKYKRKKEYMSRKMSEEEKIRNERHLFHGTSFLSVDAICKHNFDPRVSGKHATFYGQGSYFARQASYSHRYTEKAQDGSRYIFLTKVLVGKQALGKPNMRRPPPLFPENPASDLYDACVDTKVDPQIFVIFDNDQCYPYFIIRYKEVEDNITIK